MAIGNRSRYWAFVCGVSALLLLAASAQAMHKHDAPTKAPSTRQVAENSYFKAENGGMYDSGLLTGCSMVFAIGTKSACVYHWKGSVFDGYVKQMQAAIDHYIPSDRDKVVEFVIYSLERDSAEEKEKVLFAQQISSHFGVPVDLYLGGLGHTSGSYRLKFENGQVTVVYDPDGIRQLPRINPK